ncbi:unnamed protein product [Protopolystoma xenopodis]|uniref:Uncharacterized protein n=1 Tax=Protopolystoma xenopodis TaxID=117903 RepID=A0A3S5APV9_9PLAT|nr:unnamed protein product [Protopolystoma xenopodis]
MFALTRVCLQAYTGPPTAEKSVKAAYTHLQSTRPRQHTSMKRGLRKCTISNGVKRNC